jgi:nucleotide-binding universal stress UspA family protein
VYKKILMPLDGSKRAERILKHVEELARCFETKVILLQVVRHPNFLGTEMIDMVLYQKELEQRFAQAKSYLNALKGEFREKGINAAIRVVSGPVVRSILECVEDEDVDLIAIASHGHSGLKRIFYGSVAAGIMNNISRPLLIIRSRGDQ